MALVWEILPRTLEETEDGVMRYPLVGTEDALVESEETGTALEVGPTRFVLKTPVTTFADSGGLHDLTSGAATVVVALKVPGAGSDGDLFLLAARQLDQMDAYEFAVYVGSTDGTLGAALSIASSPDGFETVTDDTLAVEPDLADAWRVLVFTWKNGEHLRIYVDGVLEGEDLDVPSVTFGSDATWTMFTGAARAVEVAYVGYSASVEDVAEVTQRAVDVLASRGLRWTEPPDGGLPVTGYLIRTWDGVAVVEERVGPEVLEAEVSGDVLLVHVHALNAEGMSAPAEWAFPAESS